MNSQSQNQSPDLDKRIRDLKKINLKLSRLLRELEEERREEKKTNQS